MRTLKHLFKTIVKYRLSSALTVLSLVVSFLGIIILSLYVSYQHSFDNFHKNSENIYRFSFSLGNNINAGNLPAEQLRLLIKEKIPELEQSISLTSWGFNRYYKPEETMKDAIYGRSFAVGEDFFKMFDFPLLQGNKNEVLSKPYTLVISQSFANKMYGTSKNVVGKSLMVGRKEAYTISGIMEDIPDNSSFRSDVLVSFESFMQPDNDWRAAQTWQEWSFSLFMTLKNNANKDKVIAELSKIDKINEILENLAERSAVEKAQVKLIPLDKLRFTQGGYTFASVNEKVLDILLMLIIVLIIMGAVNFINFSTSQAPLRAKSLSVQQILGESKTKARLQIVGESVILSLIALFIALTIHQHSYLYLQDMFRIDGLALENRSMFYLWFTLCAVLFGVIAGLYPSKYITSSPIAQAVKGKMFFSGKGKRFRNVLITTQFVFTIALIASAVTIEKQLNFWNNFDIGIDKENVLYMRTSNKIRNSYKAFADELMKNTQISNYTYSQSLPGSVGMGWGREVYGKQIQITAWPIDDRFIDFFGIKMADGRKFMQGDGDINNFILNEKAISDFAWDKPLEKKFPGFDFEGDIVGISKNFNFSSLKQDLQPMLFWRTDTRKYVLMLKVKTGNYTQLMQDIEATAKKFDPAGTFKVHFLDEALERLYSKEKRMARFIEFVALWTVLLALTGLLGLIIFISRDRIKEIGIRKVNGATIFEIVKMLNSGIILWLSIAFLIATPLAYYAMTVWLSNFAYQTELSWWIFAFSGFSTLAIALLTVSFQTWRTASRNPVESLRYE